MRIFEIGGNKKSISKFYTEDFGIVANGMTCQGQNVAIYNDKCIKIFNTDTHISLEVSDFEGNISQLSWLNDMHFCISTNNGLYIFYASEEQYIQKSHSPFKETVIVKNIVYEAENEMLYILHEEGDLIEKKLDNFSFNSEPDTKLSFSGISSLGESHIILKVGVVIV